MNGERVLAAQLEKTMNLVSDHELELDLSDLMDDENPPKRAKPELVHLDFTGPTRPSLLVSKADIAAAAIGLEGSGDYGRWHVSIDRRRCSKFAYLVELDSTSKPSLRFGPVPAWLRIKKYRNFSSHLSCALKESLDAEAALWAYHHWYDSESFSGRKLLPIILARAIAISRGLKQKPISELLLPFLKSHDLPVRLVPRGLNEIKDSIFDSIQVVRAREIEKNKANAEEDDPAYLLAAGHIGSSEFSLLDQLLSDNPEYLTATATEGVVL